MVGSRAIDPEEFFAEVLAWEAGDEDECVPLTQDLYLEALSVAGIAPVMPPPYTPVQQKALSWAKGYVLAQARHQRREQALRQNEMTPESFQAMLWAALEPDGAE